MSRLESSHTEMDNFLSALGTFVRLKRHVPANISVLQQAAGKATWEAAHNPVKPAKDIDLIDRLLKDAISRARL